MCLAQIVSDDEDTDIACQPYGNAFKQRPETESKHFLKKRKAVKKGRLPFRFCSQHDGIKCLGDEIADQERPKVSKPKRERDGDD